MIAPTSGSMIAPIKVLLVEDDVIDRMAFARYVQQNRLPYDYILAQSLTEASQILDQQTFDIAILDYNLGDGYSNALFPRLKSQDCPFVIATGSGDEAIAAELLSQGANDYLIKDPDRNYLKVLPATVETTLSRHRIEGQLRLLGHAIQSVHDALLIVDEYGVVQFLNDALAQFCPIPTHTVLGQPISVLGQPALTQCLVISDPCPDSDCALDQEVTLQTVQGQHVSMSIACSYIQDGTQRFRVAIARDITQLKQTELSLRDAQETLELRVQERTAQLLASQAIICQQQEFLNLVMDSNPNLIFVKDAAGRYLLANQAMADHYRTSVEVLIGSTDADLGCNPEDAARFIQENRQILQTQTALFIPEEQSIRPDQGIQWLQWQKMPIKLPEQDDYGVLGVGVNITERKLTSQRLQEAQRIAKLGNWELDLQNNILYWSEEVFCIFEVDPTQFCPSFDAFFDFVHPDDREMFTRLYSQHLQNLRPYSLVHRLQMPDGRIKYVQAQCETIRSANGIPLILQGTVQDITQQQEAEIRREQAEGSLRQVVQGTAAVTGEQFFPNLVSHLSEALDIRYAVVSELVDNQLHTLAFCADKELQPNISYHPARTPCENTLRYGEYYCASLIQQVFPEDLDLVTMAADSYLGITLKNDLGEAIGNLCILDTEPMPMEKRDAARQILQVFAARASAELQRKRLLAELYQLNQELEARVTQRTEQLREREAQLSDLFDNATDLIQSIAPDGRILFANRAWQETLGYTGADLESLTIFDVIHPEEQQHCQQAMERLFAGASCLEIETRFLTKAGREIVVQGNVNCQIRDGQAIASRGIFRDITDRKKAQNALRESQQLLQTVLDTVPLAVFWKDRTSSYLGANSKFLQDAALASVSDLIGKNDFDMPWGSTEADIYRADDRAVMDTGEAKLNIIEPQHGWDGTQIWLETNKLPLRNLAGEVVGVLGTYQDITQRQKAELALQQQLAAIEAAVDGIAILQEDRYVYLNSSYVELFGYKSTQDLHGHSWRILYSPEQLQRFDQDIWPSLSEQMSWQGEVIATRRDGTTFPQQLSLTQLANGLLICVCQDISDRKAAERIIQQQAERQTLLQEISQRIRQTLDLQTIFDTACQEIRPVLQADRVGIFKFDPDSHWDQGEFVAESIVPGFVSALAIRIHDHCFGEKYAPLYLQGRYAAIEDIHQFEECHTNVLSQMQVRANLVMPLQCGDGLWGLLCIHQCSNPRQWQPFEIDLTQQLANQLAIAIQQANLFEQLQQELAERQQAQTQLTERNVQLAITNEELARATRLKDEFLANMSHELRTPLNAILGMTEALQDEVFGIVNERQLNALRTVEKSGNHLLALINDILDVAKIASGQVKLECAHVSMEQLCASSLAFIKQQALKKRIHLVTEIPIGLPTLYVDELRIRQALLNLLTNAVKFTPEGGTVTLAVSWLPPNPDTPDPPELRYLRIAITDTGIGIAAENIPRLFQPFVQIDSALNRKQMGTGLGLALVKQIVELHGGQIGLTSELDVGSTFTVDLPYQPEVLSPVHSDTPEIAPEVNLTQPPHHEPSANHSPLVLLAEDNPANVATVVSYLEAKGYHLVCANNGQEAIDLALLHQPDLILMDVQMPGMDGLEAIKRIRQQDNFSQTPIIVLTALAMKGDREQCIAAGANAYLSKPVKLKLLDMAIRELLADLFAD